MSAFPDPEVAAGTVVVAETGLGRFSEVLLDGRHRFIADEPKASGGDDTGPNPYELLLMSLGACTAMTLRLYAGQKKWPLERVVVHLTHRKIYAQDCADCETREGKLDRIERRIELHGQLDEAQRQRLVEIADKCPVHNTLTSEVKIDTQLIERGLSA